MSGLDQNNNEIANSLLRTNNKPVSRKEFEAFECAILASDVDRLTHLLDCWPQIELWQQRNSFASNRRLLHTAVRIGNESIVRTLLQFDRDNKLKLCDSLNSDLQSPLMMAITAARLSSVRTLLEFGAKTDSNGTKVPSSLWWAIRSLVDCLDKNRLEDKRRDLSDLIAVSAPSVSIAWAAEENQNSESKWKQELQARTEIVCILMRCSRPEDWTRKDLNGKNAIDLAKQHQLEFIFHSSYATAATVNNRKS